MALSLGKLTILVGAGILGSVIAKEGSISNVSDFVSGSFKIVFRQLRQDDSATSVKKPRNDSLVAQVNTLREELQILASSRPITIVTSSVSGASRYGVVVVIVVLGSGYIWWKGWKLPDLMFATRRSLADASNSIAKQLESVYSSIAAAKRHFSEKLDGVDHTLDDIKVITEGTDNEVSALREQTDIVSDNVESFRHAVLEMESKIRRIEGKQDLTNEGLRRLCNFASNLENRKTTERNQALASSSSRPPLELPSLPPSSRTGSLPPALSSEPPSPNSNGSNMFQQPLRTPASNSGLREFNEISEVAESPKSEVQNGIPAPEDINNSSGLLGMRFPRASFLTRTHSAASSFCLSSSSGSQIRQRQ